MPTQKEKELAEAMMKKRLGQIQLQEEIEAYASADDIMGLFRVDTDVKVLKRRIAGIKSREEQDREFYAAKNKDWQKRTSKKR